MKLDVKRQLLARSERVKGIDFHPTEPWVLTTLYSGHAHIWSYVTQAIVKSFELTDVPVRCGRFVAKKNWIVCGSDDFQLRVLNYNTSERVAAFEAHPDYIRAIAVHPTQPFLLTASDDMTIKCWNWDQGFKLVNTYEGHSHYVMSIAINPKDTNMFASACLDRTVKLWSLGSSHPSSTLEAHDTKGVNFVDFYPHSDRPFLITSSDDRTVKIWDYTTKSLVQTLEGHQNNVSFALYHPELPIIISGGEDGTVRLWHANTFRLEQTLNFGLERSWAAAVQKGKAMVAIGYDDGSVVLKLGRDEPAVSMDASGKLIYAKNNEVLSAIIKPDASIKDNEPITIPSKELGTVEVFPSSLSHSPNGRFVAVCGDGEYIIYTALAWRNKAFGSALDFAWASKDNSNDFAIRESTTSVKIFRNFVEKQGGLDVGFAADGLTAGVLLGVRGQGGISFFDWQTGGLVRRIEVEPRTVIWSESGELVCLATDDSFYVLRFSRENYLAAVQANEVAEDGVEAAFEVVTDINESIRTAVWLGDCLIYTNATNRLNYLVGDTVNLLTTYDVPMYILGYIQRDSRIYLCDKDVNLTSHALSLPVIEYQTLVLRDEMDAAAEVLEGVPQDQLNKIARFLEAQGHKELALQVATDPEHKFDLALSLNLLDIALELAREANVDHKWKTVGDAALAAWNVPLATECFLKAKDLGSLLLIYSSTADKEGLVTLAEMAEKASSHNIAFTALWLVGDVPSCVDILTQTNRLPEAALFSQTYKPSLTPDVVAKWKESLEKNKKGRVAKMIAMPGEGADEDLFPEWDEWLKLEKEGGTAKAASNGEDDGAEEATGAAAEEEAASEEAGEPEAEDEEE